MIGQGAAKYASRGVDLPFGQAVALLQARL